MPTKNPPTCIEVDGDVLIPDAEFCRLFLNGCTRRTATRYDAAGLPFAYVRGRKLRPVEAGKAWVASRVQRKNPPRRSRER